MLAVNLLTSHDNDFVNLKPKAKAMRIKAYKLGDYIKLLFLHWKPSAKQIGKLLDGRKYLQVIYLIGVDIQNI